MNPEMKQERGGTGIRITTKSQNERIELKTMMTMSRIQTNKEEKKRKGVERNEKKRERGGQHSLLFSRRELKTRKRKRKDLRKWGWGLIQKQTTQREKE